MKNIRKKFLSTGSFSAAFALLEINAHSAERPNILFILSDDQRHDELGCAGAPFLQTPVLDRLAQQGARFNNMFVTTPICMVSRATIFTGLTLRTHGYSRGPGSHPVCLTDMTASFPVLLRNTGYYTGYFGKNHVDFEGGTSVAFDRMFDAWEHIFRSPYFKKMPDGSEKYCDEIIGEQAVSFLKNRPENQPFFLFMSFNIAHAEDHDLRPGAGHFPWPKTEDGLYDDVTPSRSKLDNPAVFETLPGFLKQSENRIRYGWCWDTPEKYIINMRARSRMITGMDRIIGEVLNALSSCGADKNTIIIFTSDNGLYRGDRGLAGKWTHFEESLRVPLIIYDPRSAKAEQGENLTWPVLNLDLPATVLDFAGVKIPPTYQGRSLRPLLGNEAVRDWRTEFFCEHNKLGKTIPPWSGIHGTRYVYAIYNSQKPPYEFLHDLGKDPDQLINFSGNPEYKSILEEFRKKNVEAIQVFSRETPEKSETAPKQK